MRRAAAPAGPAALAALPAVTASAPCEIARVDAAAEACAPGRPSRAENGPQAAPAHGPVLKFSQPHARDVVPATDC